MKIKKNLTDQEMLKDFIEKESFETNAWQEKEQVAKQPKQAVEDNPLISLPKDIVEKLDKAILQLRIKLKQQGNNEIKWQVVEENDQIVLRAGSVKKQKGK